MKRKIIIMLLGIGVMGLALILNGCTNEKEELNQSMIITDDVKVDTEPKLKVLSNETIYFKEPLYWHSYGITFDEENNNIVNYTDVNGDRSIITLSKILIEGDKAELEYLGTETFYDIPDNLIFRAKNISDTSYLINNINSSDKYEVDKRMFSNDSSLYYLRGSVLLEYENAYAFLDRNKMNWTDLSSGESGTVDVPYQNIDFTNVDVVNDELFVAVRRKQDTVNNDTLVIINLKEDKIENVIELGEVSRILPIDNERVLLISRDGVNSSLEIYNISNNTRKELIKYENPYREKGDSFRDIWELYTFNDREKIYYCEVNIDKLYIKVAAINGMEIEESITVYEMDFDSKDANPMPSIAISENEMEIVVYNHNMESNSIEKFNKIKLNK